MVAKGIMRYYNSFIDGYHLHEVDNKRDFNGSIAFDKDFSH